MHELRVPFHVLDVGLQSLEEEMYQFSGSVQVLTSLSLNMCVCECICVLLTVTLFVFRVLTVCV